MQIICFHNPTEANGFLSNWYSSCFKIEGDSKGYDQIKILAEDFI